MARQFCLTLHWTSGGLIPQANLPTFDAVNDSDISFANITTGNATTSRHGFLPKGDGNAAHCLDGTLNWSTPAGTIAIGAAVTGGTANDALFIDASGNLGQSAYLAQTRGGTGQDCSGAGNGQLLIGNVGSGLQLAFLTAGSGITITNGAGAITIAGTAGGSQGPFSYNGAGSGVQNELFGSGAGVSQTTANDNTAMGYHALNATTSGGSNSAFGWQSLLACTTGANNGAFGQTALRSLTTGTNNYAFGGSLSNVTTGIGNTAVGDTAGSAAVATSYCTFLGNNTDISSDSVTKSTAIGYGARALASNTCKIGGQTANNEVLQVTTGTGTPALANGTLASIGGCIFDHVADAASSSTNGTEDDLYSDVIPINALGSNGDKIEADYCTILVSSATATRRVQAYFGGTKILDSGTLTFAAAGTADIWIRIIRESSTVVRVRAEFVPSGITLQPVVTYTRITGLTLSGINVLKITGIAAGAGAAASDIVAKLGSISWFPAAQ